VGDHFITFNAWSSHGHHASQRQRSSDIVHPVRHSVTKTAIADNEPIVRVVWNSVQLAHDSHSIRENFGGWLFLCFFYNLFARAGVQELGSLTG